MLDDLLKKIKAALPEPLKSKFLKNNEDDEDEYEDDEDFEEETKVKAKTAKNKDEEEDVDDDDDDVDEDDDEELDEIEAQKKKKQMLIRGAVVLVVAYIVVDELFLKEEPMGNPPQQVERVTPPVVANPPPQVAQQPVENPIVPEPVQETVTETPEVQPVESAEEISFEEPIEQAVVNEPVEVYQDLPESIPEPSSSEVAMEVEPEQMQDEQMQDEDMPQIGETPAVSPVQNIEIEPKVEKSQDTASEIAGIVAQKQEYASPPDYSILGRGLVYNCVGKHWACVEREQYFECRDNMIWSEQNKKSPECVIRNVYASYEDCKTIQIHYINMAEPTDFCGE